MLGDRATADVTIGQDLRRRREDERFRQKQKDLRDQLVKLRKMQKTSLFTPEPVIRPVQPRISGMVPLSELLGFEPKKRRRQRK